MSWINIHDMDKLAVYDQHVRTSAYGSFYQDRAWSKVKNTWHSDYLLVEVDDQVRGCAAFRSIGTPTGKPFVYVSRGPVLDPHDLDAWRQVMSEAIAYGEANGAFLVRFDPLYLASDELISQFESLGFRVRSAQNTGKSLSQPIWNAVMDLSNKDEEEILAGLSRRKRQMIRYGHKHNPEFSVGRTDVFFNTFEQLFQEMTERKHIGRRPFEYFVRLMEAFPAAYFALATVDDVPICMQLMLPYSHTMTYLYGASTAAFRRDGVPDALNWEQIKEAIKRDCTRYDLGGVFALDASCGLYTYKHGYCKQEGITTYIGELDVVLDEKAYAEFIKE